MWWCLSVQQESASAHCFLRPAIVRSPVLAGSRRERGGAFALVGAAYIAGKYFSASSAATLIGATQMFGMAGGSAGQFMVGPVIASGVSWSSFWIFMGYSGIALSVALFTVLPRGRTVQQQHNWISEAARALIAVFRNPQSILCGLIAGLLFVPTTIFDMIWGVRYLQEAHGLDYGSAVMRSATVPLGWIIGCPLLGYVSDRIGRRKPVIAAGAAVLLVCLGWILFGPAGRLPAYIPGFVAGLASGAAMLPYTVIKEVNPPNLSGTATGVVNFLNFTFSALLGSILGGMLVHVSSGSAQRTLEHYQMTFGPLLAGVALAIVLVPFLQETGPAKRQASQDATGS